MKKSPTSDISPPVTAPATAVTSPTAPASPSRRKFLGSVGGAAAAASVGVGTFTLPPLLNLEGTDVGAAEIGPQMGAARRNRAIQIRNVATQAALLRPLPNHTCNGDEARYPNRIGNFSKNLKHNALGEVDPAAYNAFLAALASGSNAQFDALATNGHFGCADVARRRRLVSPMAAYTFDLEGVDSHQTFMRPAPALASRERASEMAEHYWEALLRDVNFDAYNTSVMAQAAADDMSTFSDFRGPKAGGIVTPQTLFRDTYPGCTDGPYISQFLLKDAPFGAQSVDQRSATNVANIDFMTTFQDWLDVQNGCNPTQSTSGGGNVFIRGGRDLCQYVRIDALYQAYFVACLILLGNGGNGIRFDAGNPYGQVIDGGAGRPLPMGVPGSISQTGFGTFGPPHLLALLTEVSGRALKAVWYQKWLVHRNLRPEAFGGRVHVTMTGGANYPIHPELLNSPVLGGIFSRFGTYLLPQAFPEGSPNHPAYASGHATVAGACVTVLKAWFDESVAIPNPVMVNPDGLSTRPYVVGVDGPVLTVGGELNKIASNVSQGRNIAGVHWRTDGTEGNKLGEAVAISILREQKATYRENFSGFSLTKFDGTTITV